MKILSPTTIHYGVGGVLFGLYGTQVCPFIDTLSVVELLVPILVTFSALYASRRHLTIGLESIKLSYQVKTQFKIDMALFVIGGVALAAFNIFTHGFPLGSGIKVVLGMSVIGFFTACDLGLRREHHMAIKLSKSGQQIELDQSPYPLTKKFSWFASLCFITLGAIVSLVIAKDLAWLIDVSGQEDLKKAALLVSLEIAFILIVLLSYILMIISNYGSNLQLFLSFQHNTLNQVANGELNVRVPVASNDEFGVIAEHTNRTIKTLHTRTQELNQMRDVTILALSSLAETRDNETGAHILRTQHYVKVLAEHLKTHPRFESVLTTSMIDLIYKSAPLHDSGKVGIPDAILLKPGRLSEEEFEIMKQHPLIGSQALQSAQAVLGNNSFLNVACEIMETHHEKWDGTGYPAGLKGDQIPISGRLMALADVYDALISERVYKAAFSHEKAKAIIIEGKGKHFDPDVVNAFLELETTFQKIAEEFAKSTPLLRHAA